MANTAFLHIMFTAVMVSSIFQLVKSDQDISPLYQFCDSPEEESSITRFPANVYNILGSRGEEGDYLNKFAGNVDSILVLMAEEAYNIDPDKNGDRYYNTHVCNGLRPAAGVVYGYAYCTDLERYDCKVCLRSAYDFLKTCDPIARSGFSLHTTCGMSFGPNRPPESYEMLFVP